MPKQRPGATYSESQALLVDSFMAVFKGQPRRRAIAKLTGIQAIDTIPKSLCLNKTAKPAIPVVPSFHFKEDLCLFAAI